MEEESDNELFFSIKKRDGGRILYNKKLQFQLRISKYLARNQHYSIFLYLSSVHTVEHIFRC